MLVWKLHSITNGDQRIRREKGAKDVTIANEQAIV